MVFFEKLDELKEKYKNNTLTCPNGTQVLEPGKIPRGRHFIYAPLPQDMMDEWLIQSYSNQFPRSYAELLRHANGVSLYMMRLKHEKFTLAHAFLTVFGLPLTPAQYREVNGEEPFDVRIEDLGRHPDIPRGWLKFGVCAPPEYNFSHIELFIDTQSEEIFACKKEHSEILWHWKNLDSCLCELCNKGELLELEYQCST